MQHHTTAMRQLVINPMDCIMYVNDNHGFLKRIGVEWWFKRG
jgi:hypothetical protein